MSDRLTSEWTKTAEEAFGATGAKGDLGEKFMMKVFESWGWEAERHEDDRAKQVLGIDITFKKPQWFRSYTCDVKNNMDDYGNFYVHADWLMKETFEADRVFHVNPDTGWFVWYDVKEMRKAYDTTEKYMMFTAKTRLPFMEARKFK